MEEIVCGHHDWSLLDVVLYRPFIMVHFIFLDIISLNKSKFCEYVDSIYPIQFEIKESTDTDTSASYLLMSTKQYVQSNTDHCTYM
jgi:hypothetical protein